MANKIGLYYHTLKNMKPSQVAARIQKTIGKGNSLGVDVGENVYDVQPIASPAELDFDPVFLARFPVDELMEGKVTFLHSERDIDWTKHWEFDDESALWNFNLHYFEYLLPLIRAYKESKDKKYLEKTEEIISGWMSANPMGKGYAWASYTIALRIVTWLSYYGYVGNDLPERFKKNFLASLHDQYSYLSRHLEKDILGNHYFEDLKTLLLASLFFKDNALFKKVLVAFKAECREEVLSDGMHFELSPMYHKIIFEGVLRAAIALRGNGKSDEEIEGYLQPMLDVAYSFENGLDRVPLFNDGGNNIAKSLNALVDTSRNYFKLVPHFRGQLKESGFYIFIKEADGHRWKLVVDAGQPGPRYIPGHAHCDAMSFELFCDGKPVVVNCGTYAYQCKERGFFRSTAAHNTVMINGGEQSQCWGNFRLAKRGMVKVDEISPTSICMEMKDANGCVASRKIEILSDRIEITDKSKGNRIETFIHCNSEVSVNGSGKREELVQPYAEEYGLMGKINCFKFTDRDAVNQSIGFFKRGGNY